MWVVIYSDGSKEKYISLELLAMNVDRDKGVVHIEYF